MATVNGSPITQYDLELFIESTLDAQGVKLIDDQGRQKMLESLVASRAIALEQEKFLTAEQNKALEKKLESFREQVLVKMYLAQKTDQQPVTQQMVEAYYKKHPDRFGAKTIRTYELITTAPGASDTERDKILAALAGCDQVDNWKDLVKRLNKKGLPAVHRQATTETAILESKLRELIAKLEPGQSSKPTFINDTLYVVRIIEDKRVEPRPLNEVSADIRKMLLPVQLKKAIKQASDQVLKNATVAYIGATATKDESGK